MLEVVELLSTQEDPAPEIGHWKPSSRFPAGEVVLVVEVPFLVYRVLDLSLDYCHS
jgi:hypothetical protein